MKTWMFGAVKMLTRFEQEDMVNVRMLRGFGVAYTSQETRAQYICLMPFNWLAHWAIQAYWKARFPLSCKDRQFHFTEMRRAYWSGFNDASDGKVPEPKWGRL